MGEYFKAYCEEKRELLDPGDINNLGNKRGSFSHPRHPFGSVLAFAMSERWYGFAVRIVGDEQNESIYYHREDEGYADVREVTKEILDEYNESFAHVEGFEPLRYTGDD